MSDTTIIALTILLGVFAIMIVTIIKGGFEAAIRMWGVMGALTGMAFGSIISYYFTKDKFEERIASISTKNTQLEVALNNAVNNAGKVNNNIADLKAALEGKSGVKYPVAEKISASLPAAYKENLIDRLNLNIEELEKITESKPQNAMDSFEE